MKSSIIAFCSIFLVGCTAIQNTAPVVATFEDCAKNKGVVASFVDLFYGDIPARELKICTTADGQIFFAGHDPVQKSSKIRIQKPAANALVSSPLVISGEARGTWFSEGSFPIEIWNGAQEKIGSTIATAQGEWMTEDFVAFTAPLEFDLPIPHQGWGQLILRKDNPSGLPEFDDEFRIPVKF